MNQNLIEIYVRSSPLGSVGIHWRNISKNGQPMEEPEILKSRIINRGNGRKATINYLINDTKPSVILARYKGKILVEVTGLEASKERSTQLGRRITEVVLWVGDASTEVESKLRKLAAYAILSVWDENSALLKSIRDAIHFEDLDAFRVDQVGIEQLSADTDTDAENFSPKALNHSNPSVWSCPESITNDERLYSLAHQITQVPLPKTENPVVIVAEIKNGCLEYRGDIWKTPVQLATKPVALTEEVKPQCEKKTLPTQARPTLFLTRSLILGITSAIAALIIILMSLQPKPSVETTPDLTATPNPPQTTTSTPNLTTTLTPDLTAAPNLPQTTTSTPNLTTAPAPKSKITSSKVQSKAPNIRLTQ